MAIPNDKMEYRRLGNTGVKVSVLSFGSWVTFDTQLDTDLALDCMQAAHDAGCNFFDNAEAYAGGKSETIMGEALRELGMASLVVRGHDQVLLGLHGNDPNMRNTLNRKYLAQAIDASLERFGLDFVDVVYCHRADPDTPMEETVWAMSDMVEPGQGALLGHQRVVGRRDPPRDRHRRPTPSPQAGDRAVAVQPARTQQGRARVRPPLRRHRLRQHDLEPARLGPADRQVPRRHPRRLTRSAVAGYEWLADRMTDAEAIAKIEQLRPIADALGCSMAQLALAWCTKHPMVSTVITGASRVESGRRRTSRPST